MLRRHEAHRDLHNGFRCQWQTLGLPLLRPLMRRYHRYGRDLQFRLRVRRDLLMPAEWRPMIASNGHADELDRSLAARGSDQEEPDCCKCHDGGCQPFRGGRGASDQGVPNQKSGLAIVARRHLVPVLGQAQRTQRKVSSAACRARPSCRRLDKRSESFALVADGRKMAPAPKVARTRASRTTCRRGSSTLSFETWRRDSQGSATTKLQPPPTAPRDRRSTPRQRPGSSPSARRRIAAPSAASIADPDG
jgi:hypothetical protein